MSWRDRLDTGSLSASSGDESRARAFGTVSIGNGDAGKSTTNVRIGMMVCKGFVLFWGKADELDMKDVVSGRGAEMLA
ncbi:hypothetical protein BIU88_07505 [Chlorobaculum limnaeum]|uniref:Uncharacterized protein n=1 Tax=Chlorobaculum limnaeum TaxID=274537 RepID=A0A1D8D4B6_CHLLM|nr:hypothetical protein BIU88_07505 [Chlorobaculum limnaeum]